MKHDVLTIIVAIMGGVSTYLFGGFTPALGYLLGVMSIDILLGVVKAIKKHKFSPQLLLWGLIEKFVVQLSIVALVHLMQEGLHIEFPIQEITVGVLMYANCMSALKNGSYLYKPLKPLAKYFENMQIKFLKVIEVGDKE